MVMIGFSEPLVAILTLMWLFLYRLPSVRNVSCNTDIDMISPYQEWHNRLNGHDWLVSEPLVAIMTLVWFFLYRIPSVRNVSYNTDIQSSTERK